jgi:hypothetical protein
VRVYLKGNLESLLFFIDGEHELTRIIEKAEKIEQKIAALKKINDLRWVERVIKNPYPHFHKLGRKFRKERKLHIKELRSKLK